TRGGVRGMSVPVVRAVVTGCALIALSLLASVRQAPAAKGAGTAAKAPACPTFSSSNFHKPTRITNRYFPLAPGDLYTYKGNRKKQAVVDTVYVTHNTPTVDGVATVEVRDRVVESGPRLEHPLGGSAQDH